MNSGSDILSNEPYVQAGELHLSIEASELRQEIVESLYVCGGGHYGGALSVLDVLLTLYRHNIRVLPQEPRHIKRDQLILSKGHAAISLYAVLRRLGFFDTSLSSYGQVHSALEGHPDMTVLPGIDFSTGSLGQGLSIGLGIALALKNTGQHTWVILGDGECQEGQIWEAAMLGARYHVDNLHAVIDANNFQEYGWKDIPAIFGSPIEDLSLKWKAFGWRVFEVDGHDYGALVATFKEVELTVGQPSIVIARTVKGKGYPLIEQNPSRFHCTTVSASEQEKLLRGNL
jgi:transketolase